MELQDAYHLFQERNVEIVAISTDDISGAAQMAGLADAAFPVLADPDARTAKSYEVFDLLGDGVAAPAVFIVGKGRVVLTRYVGSDIADRPTVAEILTQLDGLGAPARE